MFVGVHVGVSGEKIHPVRSFSQRFALIVPNLVLPVSDNWLVVQHTDSAVPDDHCSARGGHF